MPIDPDLAPDLWPTRVVLHHLAQLASALGATHLDPDPESQYANLAWDPQRNALVGRAVGALQAAVRVPDATLLLIEDGRDAELRRLEGLTLSEALTWLQERVEHHHGPSGPLAPVGYALPEHPVAGGTVPIPQLNRTHLAALAAWFDQAHHITGEVARTQEGASEPRCWPHHFDLATRITLDPGLDADEARSIGVGMTPGDAGIGEPYWYVNPWPVPEARSGPELPHDGRWHTEGFFGAVLVGSDLPATGADAAVASFVDAAIGACRELLGVSAD